MQNLMKQQPIEFLPGQGFDESRIEVKIPAIRTGCWDLLRQDRCSMEEQSPEKGMSAPQPYPG